MSKIGLIYNPEIDRIFSGRLAARRKVFVGKPQDVTNLFVNVLTKYISINSARVMPKRDGTASVVLMNTLVDEQSLEKAIEYLQKIKENIKKE